MSRKRGLYTLVRNTHGASRGGLLHSQLFYISLERCFEWVWVHQAAWKCSGIEGLREHPWMVKEP